MPCDRIYVQSVDFSKCDETILKQALHNLGYVVFPTVDGLAFNTHLGRATIGDGKISVEGNVSEAQVQALGVSIRSEHLRESARQGGKRTGWTMQITGPNKFKMKKRA